MKISIVTATYNSLKSLPTALESIQKQTYKNIEWIIVDGQSTDGTLDYIRKNENLIEQWISEPDKGIYDALNKGIAMATGDIIGLLHSDDLYYDEETLKKIADVFENHEVDGVYGDLEYVSKDQVDKVIRFWKSKPFQPELLNQGWMVAHPSMFLKKEVYSNYGDFDLSYKISADYDFILRIFKETELKFQYIPEVITKMRVGGASNRSLQNIIKKSKEDLIALRKSKIKRPFLTLIRKNLCKINQFVIKQKTQKI